MSCEKIDLLFSRSRSMQDLIWSKYDNFCCIFWIAAPFATKPGLIVHYHKPECFMEKLDCIIMSQIVFQKDWFAVLKVKVTVKDNIIKVWLFNVLSELLILLQLNLVWWYIIIRWIVKYLTAPLWSRSRSQKRLRIPVNVHLDDISSAAEPSVTKLGMVMQHHGPKCHARRLVYCLQVQGHSEGSFNQIIRLFLPCLLNC